MSVSDFDEEGLTVRTTGRAPRLVPRYDVLDDFAQLAAAERSTVPVARTFGMEDWRMALDLYGSGHVRGKLLILPEGAASPA